MDAYRERSIDDMLGAEARKGSDEVRRLYDVQLSGGDEARALIFSAVFGEDGFVGQYSDNTAEQILEMARRSRIGPLTHLLDIGCGACGPAALLVERLRCRVTGIDVSRHHLARGKARVVQSGLRDRIELIDGDLFDVADRLPHFDVIIGLGSFCHFYPKALFSRCRDLLVPTGRIAFMERVALGRLPSELRRELTEGWACPTVETFASYYAALKACGFGNVFIDDLSGGFAQLQRRFVDARKELRERLLGIMGEAAYSRDLAMVEGECRAAEAGLLGYGLFLADRIDE